MERALRSTLKNGRFENVPLVRSNAMRAVRGKGNKSTEQRFRMALVCAGISGWCLHPEWVDGKPDVYFDSHKLAIFLDGCFWHGCPKCGHIPKTNTAFWAAKIERNKKRDRSKRRRLRRDGFEVLRFWEHELKSNLSVCVEKIENAIS